MEWLVQQAMCAFFPRHGDLPGLAELDVAEFVARYRRESGAIIWLGVVLGTLVFTAAPIITVYLPVPSFFLSARLRDRHADRLAGHSFYLVRQVALLVKMVGGMCWGQHPEVRKQLALPAYDVDPDSWRTS